VGLVNLTDLNLSSDSFTNLNGLLALTKLTSLTLGGNPISDASALAGLPS